MGFLRELLKKETLTERLFKFVDDYEIYCELIGLEIEIGECISSPIRASDDTPSFALYVPTRIPNIRPDEIWFKDLADGRYGDIFKFTKYFALHHYGEVLENNYAVTKFLDARLNLNMFNGKAIELRERIVKEYVPRNLNTEIYYKSRPYTRRDLTDYWNNLFLDAEDLNHFNVKSVRYLLDEYGNVRKEFRKNDLAYIYPIFNKEKLYQPEAIKSMKFRNTCPGNDYRYYQGFPQIEFKSKTLIITKSMKDVMVFWKFFNKFLETPVEVLAPAAESIKLSDEFVEWAKENFDHIICVSDYDLAGVKFAQHCKSFGFSYKFISTERILINGKYKVLDKDISDFVWNNGYNPTIKLLKSWKLNTL